MKLNEKKELLKEIELLDDHFNHDKNKGRICD